MISGARKALVRFAAALVCALAASTAAALANDIQVNKSFTPNVLQLGGTSLVTITFQNNSTLSAATVNAFQDDIATMGGKAAIASPSGLTTTCAGGTPSISGTVVSMNDGSIPIAPNSNTPGTCSISFNVVATAIGNGFNTIYSSNVQTSLGSPSNDVTQTLSVQPVNIVVSNSAAVTTLLGTTASITFTIANPTGTALTNTAFPVTFNSATAITITGATSNCGATATLPPAGTAGTLSFAGGTIPANGSCTVTISGTSPATATGNFTIGSAAVTNSQGATNTNGASTQIKWVLGNPNLTKAFSPTGISQGQTTTMTITVQNIFSAQSLTNAAFTDVLPASLTLLNSPAPVLTNCTGTVGGFGTGTVTFSGFTIPAASTCKIVVTIQAPATQPVGGVTNTIPQNGFTSDQVSGFGQSASASLSIAGAGGGGLTATKSVSPSSAAPNAPITVTLKFTAFGGGTFTNGSFVDALPQTPAPMAAVTTTAPAFNNCGPSPAVSFSSANTVVTGSNLAIPNANGTCTVTFTIAFTTPVATTMIDVNSIPNPNVSFTDKTNAVQTTGTNSVNITENPAFSVTNYVASAGGLINQPLTMQASINDPAQITDNNATAVIVLNPGKVALAPQPNFTFGASCPPGLSAANITIGANGESFTIGPIASISASCTIGYNVIDEGGASGTFVPGKPTYQSALTGGVALSFTGTNNATWVSSSLNVTKAFTPNQIQAGSISTTDVTITVQPAGTLAQTQANGVGFADPLPANLAFAPSPNVNFSAGCKQSGQPAPSYVIVGTTITVSNLSLLTVGSTPVACDVTFAVTSLVVGAPLNQLASGSLTSTSGITNPQSAKASLTVASGLGLQKSFLESQVTSGGTTYMRLVVSNSATNTPIAGATIADTMPSALVLASTALGPTLPGDPVGCGGTISSAIGSSTIMLGGMTVPALTPGGTAGQCVVYVLVAAKAGAAPGVVTNTIPAGGLSAGGFTNRDPASAAITIASAPNPTIFKSFSPTTIAPNAASVLTITINNTESGAVALTSVALADALPANLFIDSLPNAATTCGGGTVSAVAGGTSVSLANGTVGANASCTISVRVTSASSGTYTNAIPAGALSTAQGATNVSPASASLVVQTQSTVTLTKSFSPSTVPAGSPSQLTITIANTSASAVPLTNLALTDTLPTGLTVSSTPAASTTCPSGTVSAASGASSISLSGAQLAAGATCTLSVNVASAVVGVYPNSIPAGAVTSAQSITNSNPASATLNVTIPSTLTVAKTFAPAQIEPGAPSLLTITIENTNTGAQSVTDMSLVDTLPSGLTVHPNAAASTTCNGAITAIAGTNSVALSGGSLAAGATCTISVNVTGLTVGTYTNTIPSGSIATNQGVTNPNPSAASVVVITPPPSTIDVEKSFSIPQISPGTPSVLTISLNNTSANAVALTNLGVTDSLPAGIVVFTTPGAATTCGAGVVTAIAAGTSVALAGGSLAAGASCTVTASVTGAVDGSYTNTIAPAAVTNTQGISNPSASSATLTIQSQANVTLSKAFLPALIAPNGTSVLTITVANNNPGAVALTNVGLTDALPVGLNVYATPGATTTCARGTVAAVAGSTTIGLSGATLAAGATCTISVSVTGAAAGTFTNTIPVGSLTSTQNVSNRAPASATLTIASPSLSVTKSSNPQGAQVSPGQTIVYTIVVTNNGSVVETNAKVTDTLTNATLVSGTVTVNGTAAPDSVITAGTPFGTLAPGATATIAYRATVNQNAAAGALVTNNVVVGGDQPCTGSSCSAVSPPNTVAPPVLAISKTIDGQAQINALPNQTVTYAMVVTNTGTGNAQNAVITDPVPSGLAPLSGTAKLNGAPVTSATVKDQIVTIPIGTLAPGASVTVTFQASVKSTATGTHSNVATLTSSDLAESIASNPAVATIIPPALDVSKRANASVVSVGDRVDYEITVSPLHGAVYGDTAIVDTLPNFEVYAPGTAKINGVASEPAVTGHVLTWRVSSLSDTLTITYSVAIASGVPGNSTLTNTVVATAQGPGGSVGTGLASASVLVAASAFGSCYPITGRVYLDLKDSGHFEKGDTALSGVRIYLDDGESVVTDGNGRYNFPCVRPGMHALRLDETTLPSTAEPFDDRNIDSERSTRRLVHSTFDTYIIQDINFALKPPDH